MKPNVEPSLLHVSTHKRIRVYPIFFSRRELTNETTLLITLSSKDSKTEQHQAATAALPLLQVAATTAAVTRTTNTL
ncbi:unnamed protein product [Brassica rapa subsp. trilocularis]